MNIRVKTLINMLLEGKKIEGKAETLDVIRTRTFYRRILDYFQEELEIRSEEFDEYRELEELFEGMFYLIRMGYTAVLNNRMKDSLLANKKHFNNSITLKTELQYYQSTKFKNLDLSELGEDELKELAEKLTLLLQQRSEN